MNQPNPLWRVVVTDHRFADVETEREIIESAGGTLHVAQCETSAEVIEAARGADALLVQWAPLDAGVLAALDNCKLIVRYGIGVDNVDLEAAKARGIAVCNVPDYGTNEVADHAVALALALARQISFLDRRTREGEWKVAPVSPMPAFNEMTFGVAGFGRIGREVLNRARGFGFRLAAYDPFVEAGAMSTQGVTKLSLEALFSEADVLSLHLPLNEQTHHLVNAGRLQAMKPHAILINTARGALIDTRALADALQNQVIAYAGLDVFETEPMEKDHPLWNCPNAVFTPHIAWYSQSSSPRLQRLAGEEIARGIKREPFKNQIN